MALVLTAEEMADEENKDSSRTFEDILRERIKTALEEAVEEQDTERKIGEEMAARVNILQDVSKELAERLGREPKVEELAERMKMTPDQIKEIMKVTMDALSITGEEG